MCICACAGQAGLAAPMFYASYGLMYDILQLSDRCTAVGRFNINTGSWKAQHNPLVQVIGGVDVRYRLSSLRIFGENSVGIHLVASTGWGRDFSNNVSRGYLNLGLGMSDWLIVSFDLSSLWLPGNVLMNYARVR